MATNASTLAVDGRPLGSRRRLFQCALVAALAIYFLHAGTGFPGFVPEAVFSFGIHVAVMVAAAGICVWRARDPGERVIWGCFAVALGTYAAGEIVWRVVYQGLDPAPYPSVADALWLAFYPFSYVGIVLLVRRRVTRFRASMWLDGVLGGLAVAAAASAFLVAPVLELTGGSTATVVTTIAYPLGDVLLISLVIGVFALTGFRPGREWGLLGIGLGLNAVADVLYVLGSAAGTYVEGSVSDALFPAAALTLAWAAFQTPSRRRDIDLEGVGVLFAPAVFALTALVLTAFGFAGKLEPVSQILTLATLVAVIGRAMLSLGENLRMLRRSREESLTDALTGLGNRRRLMTDLGVALAESTREEPAALMLFDLDGFKLYNDAFGHPAGDALIARLGCTLGETVAARGCAYRLGGDEFCVLMRLAEPELEAALAEAVAALSEQGEGFRITNSHGAVLLPLEARTEAAALGLVDQRMYGDKRERKARPGIPPELVLGVLRDREAEEDGPTPQTTLALDVGRRLGLTGESLDELARAAELHDVGKLAIPDQILEKPGALNEAEWAFVRRHPLIGERIIGLAPALRPVGRIVRASHERFDGQGYPDGIGGGAIPVAARVVAVFDAFKGMITDRPDRPGLTPAAALAELRRGRGDQFDPAVVDAFRAAWEERMAEFGRLQAGV